MYLFVFAITHSHKTLYYIAVDIGIQLHNLEHQNLAEVCHFFVYVRLWHKHKKTLVLKTNP